MLPPDAPCSVSVTKQPPAGATNDVSLASACDRPVPSGSTGTLPYVEVADGVAVKLGVSEGVGETDEVWVPVRV